MRVQGANTAGGNPQIKGATDAQTQQIIHRALVAIKAGRYNLCQNIVVQGLKTVPDDHDLLFLRAFLAQDRGAQQTLDETVSPEMRQACTEQIVDYKAHMAQVTGKPHDTLMLSEEAEAQINVASQYSDPAGVMGAMAGNKQGTRPEASPSKRQNTWITYGGIVAIGLALVLFICGGGWWSTLPLIAGIIAFILDRTR